MTMLPLLKGQSAGLTEKILMDTLSMFKCHRHHKKRKLLEDQQVSNKKTKIEELENENQWLKEDWICIICMSNQVGVVELIESINH